jgi:hypothetical protein
MDMRKNPRSARDLEMGESNQIHPTNQLRRKDSLDFYGIKATTSRILCRAVLWEVKAGIKLILQLQAIVSFKTYYGSGRTVHSIKGGKFKSS